MNTIKEYNFIARFMFDTRYRIWRHVLLILFVGIITFNQVFIAYQDSQALLGNRIYLVCFLSFAMYLAAMYFNYFYLTPKFLIRGRYIIFLMLLCIIVFLLPNIAIVLEYRMRQYYGLPHRVNAYNNPLILLDNLSGSIVTSICFCGVSFVMLFRSWATGNEYIGWLRRENINSELNKLKGQLAPAFLSRTLQRASASVPSSPETASEMLMRLGRLLRYQLYDANRDKILLRSEINMLRKFVELEQMNRTGFYFDIHTKGSLDDVFVTPLLFIAMVQNAVKNSSRMDLFFNLERGILSFVCSTDSNDQPCEELFSSVKKRLELLYPGGHTLAFSGGMIELKIHISK